MSKQAEVIGFIYTSWWKRLWWILRGDVFIPNLIVTARINRQHTTGVVDYEFVTFNKDGLTMECTFDVVPDIPFLVELDRLGVGPGVPLLRVYDPRPRIYRNAKPVQLLRNKADPDFPAPVLNRDSTLHILGGRFLRLPCALVMAMYIRHQNSSC